MPSCCLIRPAGTSPTSSTSPATSPCCRCRQNHPNSTRSKTSGNSCATTGSPIVSSGPTTTSLSTVATPGTNSSISLGPSCRSACATGPTGSDQRDLVLDVSAPPAKAAKERDQQQRAQNSPTKQQPCLIDGEGQPGLLHQWRDQVAGLLVHGPERLTGEPVERHANKLGCCAIASLQALDEGC